MHVIFIITFLFVCLLLGRFFCKKNFFKKNLEFSICKFDVNKNKNLLKKKEFVTVVIVFCPCYHFRCFFQFIMF